MAADQSNNADDGSGLDAFISGGIVDAQTRYNLRNLVQANKVVPEELAVLERLCVTAQVPAPADVAKQIADGLRASWEGGENTVLPPQKLEQLSWYGVAPAVVSQLANWVTLLPLPTTVNINTAPREVIVAVVERLDPASAERLIQSRQRKPFETMAGAVAALPTMTPPLDLHRLGVASAYFEVQGQIRLGDRALQERSLVRRDGTVVVTVQRERVNINSSGS